MRQQVGQLEQLPFFIHYLDYKLKSKVNNFLQQQGIKLPNTFSPEMYKFISNRLSRVFNKTNQYNKSFINTWSVPNTPGFIVYASDNEDIVLYHSKKKKKLNIESAIRMLELGTRVIYYGDEDLTELECFASKNRRDNSEKQFIKNLPLLEENQMNVKFPSPFNSQIVVYKLNHPVYLSIAPPYVQALDTLVPGVSLFNAKGEFVLNSFAKKVRYVCAIDYPGTTIINKLSDVSNDDILVKPHDCLIPKNRVRLNELLLAEFKKKKLRILGKTGMTVVLLNTLRKSFRLTTFLEVTNVIIYNKDKPFTSDMLSLLLLTSFSNTITFDEQDFEEARSISSVSIAHERYSSGLLSFALQLRKTFLMDNDLGLTVIAPKAGLKSTVISILNEVNPEIITIDSDTYARWVSSKINDDNFSVKQLNDNNNYPSYFEEMAKLMLRENKFGFEKCVELFKVGFSKVLSHEEYGIAKFQDAIYDSYQTTKVMLFLHTTVEANLLSGGWQQVVIRPIHDTYSAIRSRNRINEDENIFLHSVYQMITPTSNRACVNWIEFFLLVSPNSISLMRERFSLLQCQ